MRLKVILLSCLFGICLFPTNVFAQNAVEITYENLLHAQKFNLINKAKPNAEITNLQTKTTNAIVQKGIELPKSFTPEIIYGVEQKKPIAFLNVPRFIKNTDGSITELLSFNTKIIEGSEAAKNNRGQRVYAANSVLANGNWFKFKLSNRGVAKIDYAFFKALGIDVDNINPVNIRIYGNGGGILPENNATARADDLLENAIELIGMADGKFNNGDYVLLYSNGPHKIIADSTQKLFKHEFNIYDDNAYYFINTDIGAGKRVATNNTSGTPTLQISTANVFDFYEKDSFNFNQTGKEWWGEQLSNRTSNLLFTKKFTIPNILQGSLVTVTCNLASQCLAGLSSFNATINGNNLFNVNFATVGTSFGDKTADSRIINKTYTASSDNAEIALKYNTSNEFAIGAIGSIAINAKRNLVFNSGQFAFADLDTFSSGWKQYNIKANKIIKVWDVSKPTNVTAMQLSNNGNNPYFVAEANKLQEFVCFEEADFINPIAIGKISNQNLHNSQQVKYVIIAHPAFINQAQQLAEHHISRGTSTAVVTTAQIYNEFGSGAQDITAIRDFIKMYYDKANTVNLQNVLLFGDASYDFKDRVANNSNYIPSRESDESMVRINTFVSDDYFAILDDEEYIGSSTIANTLDVGIGRITCNTAAEAQDYINKIKNYNSNKAFGSWKNNVTFIADDMDSYGSIHMDDGELMCGVIKDSANFLNIYKIYLDGFQIEPTAGGYRCPSAQSAINAQLFNGTLVMNYNGHGSPSAWTEERIFTIQNISEYNNYNKLPLYVTATCDFAPYNLPALKSAGEILLTYSKGGAIALMTTTAAVFQSENKKINKDWWQGVLTHNATTNAYPTFGESIRLAKNKTYSNIWPEDFFINYRKFVMLGDPALSFNMPTKKVTIDSINGNSFNALNKDTIKALSKIALKGSITDLAGNTASNFNGEVEITIFDKPKKVRTLTTNPRDPKRIYELQNAQVFKGKANVVNGKYAISFITPKDLNYDFGFGKISMYAFSSTEDAQGYNPTIVIGGSSKELIVDNDAPIIKPFLNDTKFLNGGLTGPNSTLILQLSDSSGINASGAGVGHDITAVLDGNVGQPIVLNNFYNGEKDNYKQGTVQYPLRGLAEGKHTLTFKAWDVLNNSGTASLDFVVSKATTPTLTRVLNYPNPFTTKTNFWFEHNYPGELLYVTINIYSISGKIVKSINQLVNSPGSQVRDLEWDGKDQYGDRLGKGVYLYQISYKTASGFSANKLQKLVIL